MNDNQAPTDRLSAIDLTVKGKPVRRRAIDVLGTRVVIDGRLLSTGRVFDEYWLEQAALPAPDKLIAALSREPNRPDIFTFAQRVPENKANHGYYYEWENVAVLPLTTYEDWIKGQVHASTRRNIKSSEKRGITTKVCEYDDAYVQGISSIFNETPIRAGRKYWHYGKDIESVRRENGTYASRSIFVAAYCGDEMVGYAKIVWDRRTAAIMQILSKIGYRDHRTNNALMAEAVRQTCSRKIDYLLYEKFDYGNKVNDSLTRFKQNNGFGRMDVPRYYVPLTAKGRVALQLGLHRRLRDRVPERIAAPLRNLRSRWYEGKPEPQGERGG